jgi:hypothetical protein
MKRNDIGDSYCAWLLGCSVTVEAIGPGRGPRQLTRGETRGMNLNDDVVYRCLRLGPLHQLADRSVSQQGHHQDV